MNDIHTPATMQRERFLNVASTEPGTRTISHNDTRMRHESASSDAIPEGPLVESSSIRKRRRCLPASTEHSARSPTPHSPHDGLFDFNFPECGMQDNVQLPDLRPQNHSETDRLSSHWILQAENSALTHWQCPSQTIDTLSVNIRSASRGYPIGWRKALFNKHARNYWNPSNTKLAWYIYHRESGRWWSTSLTPGRGTHDLRKESGRTSMKTREKLSSQFRTRLLCHLQMQSNCG